MSIFITKTYWVNRLFTNKDQFSYWKDESWQTVTELFHRTIYSWFDHPLFSTTLLIKNSEEKLAIAGINNKMFAVWKGILLVIGALNGIGIYALTTKAIISPLLFVVILFALLGFLLPELYLIDRLQQIEFEIHNDFPRFLDLLYIYTSTAAFEHIGNAMFAISEHMSGVLSKQLRDITIIYRFVDVNSFLDRFENRFRTPLARDLVSTLRLADAYGGNISEKIGILAEEAHKERMQNARQKGQQASAMLLVPLMLFHFPVAVIIFLAPTALALKQVFGW